MNEQSINPTSAEATAVEDSTDNVDPIDAELTTLRENLEKQRLNASQKITSMGQENSDLQAQLQAQQAEINQLRSGVPSDTQPDVDLSLLTRGYQEISNELVDMRKREVQRDQASAVNQQIQNLQKQFGVSAEDAQLINDYNQSGDFQSAYRVAELNSIRNRRKTEQADQRAAAGAPLPQARRANTSSKPQVSESELADQLENMSPTDRASAIAKNPDLLQILRR
tara:strand:+ start:4183 stop:4857 length:675 start_codon:yes stop_codon:yes gene_type:complete